MKRFFVLLAIFMFFSMTSCGTPNQNPSTSTHEPKNNSNLVGVSMPTKELQRWIQDGNNVKNQLETAGYSVDIQYASNDVATQISQVEDLIAKNCKVLVIAPIDCEAEDLAIVLEKAKEKSIPVISYDRLIMNSDAVSYYATFDNWLVGVTQGKFIEDALDLKNADGPFNIEFITGDPGDNNINFFFDGAMSILQPYLDSGKLVCPSGQTDKSVVATANWATDAAQSRFERVLSSYYADGTKLDAVLASNDSIALGVENALDCAYNGEWPVITGQDCDLLNIPNLLNGKQDMSVFKDTRVLASEIVKMVDALMKDEDPPINNTKTYDNGTGIIPSYLCESVLCTSENYQEVLVESGYYTADQIALP